MWASYSSWPLALNSEKYGSAPQPMNTSPFSRICMLPWLPEDSGMPGCSYWASSVSVFACGFTARTTPRDCA